MSRATLGCRRSVGGRLSRISRRRTQHHGLHCRIEPYLDSRRDLTEERTREKQRAEKLLESAAIKISSVLTDLHGVTGRDIMDRLIAGQRNPKVLAQLARAAARRKISQLEEALEGAEFFTPAHAALLAKMLTRTGRLAADIEDLTAVTERLLAPYEEQLQQAEAGARLGPARRPGRRCRNRR